MRRCCKADIDAVAVATPNHLHCARRHGAAGKHAAESRSVTAQDAREIQLRCPANVVAMVNYTVIQRSRLIGDD
jgi:hypothetical protein